MENLKNVRSNCMAFGWQEDQCGCCCCNPLQNKPHLFLKSPYFQRAGQLHKHSLAHFVYINESFRGIEVYGRILTANDDEEQKKTGRASN